MVIKINSNYFNYNNVSCITFNEENCTIYVTTSDGNTIGFARRPEKTFLLKEERFYDAVINNHTFVEL